MRPDKPENTLALMTSPGLYKQIPLGAFVAICHNGTNIPLVLEYVDKETIRLKCACGKPECKRRVTFKAKWQGRRGCALVEKEI